MQISSKKYKNCSQSSLRNIFSKDVRKKSLQHIQIPQLLNILQIYQNIRKQYANYTKKNKAKQC